MEYENYIFSETSFPWLICVFVLLVCAFGFLIILLVRSCRLSKRLEQLVKVRTQELELKAATLTALFDSIPDLIYTKDLDLRFTQCNKSMVEHFNLRKEDILGHTDLTHFGLPAEIVLKHNDLLREAIHDGKIHLSEGPLPHFDGTTPFFESTHAPLLLNGETVGVFGISRNITRRKEMEEAALVASQSKSAFLANMSHEIRTPMNSIIGFTELAMDDNISQRTRDYLSKLLESAEGLLEIINNVLDLSKIESGKVELKNIPFKLHELFASCKTLTAPIADEKGIPLHFYAEPFVGVVPLGDPTRLRQVIVNLLTNAIKFTDTGIVKLCAAINERTDDSITIHFTVRDSGIGMTPEQIEKIFEPFAQAEAKTMRKCAGTGLGLPIAKNIIELMGGKLFVESAPEAGSKFSFDLTFNTIKADSEELNKKIHMGEIKRPSFNAEVLLCEDNLMNQQVICEHFEKVGLKIAVAENGKIAVDFVKKRKENNEKQFDIIFMDINMPVMDGLEASAKIHEIDSTIPIIAITANMIDNNNDIYAKAGMKDFISKPFTSQELWHCLLRFLTPSETASEKTDNDTKTEADKEFQIYLKTLFIKNNKEKYQEIVKALEAGDTKLANRLAHTLKSNSGQLGLNALHQAADDVEKHLAGGENLVLPQQLTALEYELNQAILQLAQIVTQYNELNPVNSNFNSDETQNLMDIQSTLELLDKLEPMLKFGNTKSLEYIDSLYQIYADNTVKNQLVQHIKEFDFEIALGLLFQIREQLNTD